MNLRKSKIFKCLSMLFILVASIIYDDVMAKEITCKYSINTNVYDVPYDSLTVVYSDDGTPVNVGYDNLKYEGQEFVMYFQFDNGKKYGVDSKYRPDYQAMWDGSAASAYINNTLLDSWRDSVCLENPHVFYNSDASAIVIAENGDSINAHYGTKENPTNRAAILKLAYNSINGNLYTVEFETSAGGEHFWKEVKVYEGQLVTAPTLDEIGASKYKGNSVFCWNYEGLEYDFSKPINSDMYFFGSYCDYTSGINTSPTIGELSGKSVLCNGEEIPYGLPYIVSKVINLIKILTPIILIVMGMIDMSKAVISSDEKQMRDGTSKFIRRIIAGVVIFFVIFIVQFVFKVFGEDDDGYLGCFDCFISGESCDPFYSSGSGSSQTGGSNNSSVGGSSQTGGSFHQSSSDKTHGGGGRGR